MGSGTGIPLWTGHQNIKLCKSVYKVKFHINNQFNERKEINPMQIGIACLMKFKWLMHHQKEQSHHKCGEREVRDRGQFQEFIEIVPCIEHWNHHSNWHLTSKRYKLNSAIYGTVGAVWSDFKNFSGWKLGRISCTLVKLIHYSFFK